MKICRHFHLAANLLADPFALYWVARDFQFDHLKEIAEKSMMKAALAIACIHDCSFWIQTYSQTMHNKG